MKPSQDCYDLIMQFEGLSLKAYPDPATGGEPWTIGYGHTGDVRKGDEITEEEAYELLVADVDYFAQEVDRCIQSDITQNEFDALVCFAYNVGIGNLKSSTLLRLINQGKMYEASQQFKRWNKANGKVMLGLTRRRQAEEVLFNA